MGVARVVVRGVGHDDTPINLKFIKFIRNSKNQSIQKEVNKSENKKTKKGRA